jgi:hypothetical protein
MNRWLVSFVKEYANYCLCGFFVVRTVESKCGSRVPLVAEFGLLTKYGDRFHGVVTISDVYVFIKRVGDDLKMLISQEGVIEENGEPAPDDYFKKMCDLGLTELMPFLKEVKTERVLWGFDAKNKTVKIYSPDRMFHAAACGSAVRGCIGIGKKLAAEVVKG